jgi:hypothetical protein
MKTADELLVEKKFCEKLIRCKTKEDIKMCFVAKGTEISDELAGNFAELFPMLQEAFSKIDKSEVIEIKKGIEKIIEDKDLEKSVGGDFYSSGVKFGVCSLAASAVSVGLAALSGLETKLKIQKAKRILHNPDATMVEKVVAVKNAVYAVGLTIIPSSLSLAGLVGACMSFGSKKKF